MEENMPNSSNENATNNVAESTTENVETTNAVETENPVTENAGAIASVESETKPEPNAVEEEKIEQPVKEKYVDVDHKIKVVALSLEKMVEDRAATNMGALTEKELLATIGGNLAGVTISVERNTENENEGYINFTEFVKTVRVPEEGFFTFGIDYSQPAK